MTHAGGGPAQWPAGTRGDSPTPAAGEVRGGLTVVAGARIDVAFRLNGAECRLAVEPRELLIDVLRERCGLTGVKRSCDVEVCGACTVLVDGLPVSSCTTLALEADGRDVLTIEGLAGDGGLHPVQRAFVTHGALQCGFCTPGMILSVVALLRLHPRPTEAEIRHVLRGNLCRCTGYVKILDAVRSLVPGSDPEPR